MEDLVHPASPGKDVPAGPGPRLHAARGGEAPLAVFGNLAVVLDAHRCRAEQVGVLAVEERVEHEQQRIGVAAILTSEDASGAAVEHPRTHIDRGLIVQDAYLGTLRRRSAFERFVLYEVRDHGGRRPDFVVQAPVDCCWCVGGNAPGDAAGCGLIGGLCCCCGEG